MMTDFYRTVMTILLASFIVSGCGDTTPVLETAEDPELKGNANRFVDWEVVDWKFVLPFSPYMYPASARFNNFKYATPYDDFTHYKARMTALDLEEFRKLPQTLRDQRRQAAQSTLYEAMAFDRIIAWSWEIWVRSLTQQVAKEAWFYDYGIITPAIMYLEQAAGEDPGNPFTWSHLAFFTGLVGNSSRQTEALNNAFEALSYYENQNPDLAPEKHKELHLMRLRMLLDRAWLLRDKARFDESMDNTRRALALMNDDEYRTHDQAREALLLKALLLVDMGHYAEAQDMANNFKKWNLPVYAFSGGSVPFSKHVLNHVNSDFSRQWVWDMCHMKLGNTARALRPPGFQAGWLEYPPHLGRRFWQDMGRIREHFGERGKAGTFYMKGFMCRPFLSFYPTSITTGYTPIFGQQESGNYHFLGYRDFFLGGSEFAYAANRVASMERAFNKNKLEKYGNEAIESLTACYGKGIRPLSSLALRGYAYTLLNQPEQGERDLREADRLLTEAGRENPQVIRLLATLYYNRKAYQESHDLLARYLKLKPDNAATWRFDGVILAEMDRFDEGLKALNTSLVLDPNSTAGYYNRALVLLHLGQIKAAQDDLARALELSPGNMEITRISQLIRNDPQTRVEFQHQRQKWNISPADLSETQVENLAIGLTGEKLLTLMEKLKTDYSDKPSMESRISFGFALKENSQWVDLQELLTPMWPGKISLQGSLLLLQADRALGQPSRAVEMAQSLDEDSGVVAEPRLWTLVAVICHESGKMVEGNSALELALELDPENRALQMMRAQMRN